jgi:hypothetical protein
VINNYLCCVSLAPISSPTQLPKKPEAVEETLVGNNNSGEKEEEVANTTTTTTASNSFLVISVTGSSTDTSWSSHETTSSSGSYSVLATELEAEKQRWSAHKVASAPPPPSGEGAAPEVQRTLASKNKEALEAIRQSLSNKLVNPMPPSRVVESMRASGSCGSLDLLLLPMNSAANSCSDVAALKADAGKESTKGVSHSSENVSSSFEEARANLQDLLLLGRPSPLATGATLKRPAPLPPPELTNELTEGDQLTPSAVEVKESSIAVEEGEGVGGDAQQEQVLNLAESSATQTPKLTPAIR